MSSPSRFRNRNTILTTGAVLLVGAGVAGYLAFADCDICLAQTIPLSGSVAQNCTIVVNTLSGAATLDLTASGPHSVDVGTIVQNCNKKVGYTLTVASSATCSSPTPAGAKLYDSTSTEFQAYSVAFANPSGGNTSNLLASSCAAATGRDVTNTKITGDTSTVSVNYTASGALAAGTYTDTLTIAMVVKL